VQWQISAYDEMGIILNASYQETVTFCWMVSVPKQQKNPVLLEQSVFSGLPAVFKTADICDTNFTVCDCVFATPIQYGVSCRRHEKRRVHKGRHALWKQLHTVQNTAFVN
jgi:hypothetical protein